MTRLMLCLISACFSVSACAAGATKADARGFVQTSAKKGGSGVNVAYRVDGSGQPNVPVQVTVEFSGVRAPGGATASFAAEAPAVLNAPGLTLSPGQRHSTTLTVTAPADGIYFVNVTTVQDGRPSVVSIPLKVGTGGVRLQKQGTVQTMPSGEKVISLPSK